MTHESRHDQAPVKSLPALPAPNPNLVTPHALTCGGCVPALPCRSRPCVARSSRPRCTKASSRFFRYCPPCLSRGCHCVVHQFETIRTCTLHKTALEIECRGCGYWAATPNFVLRVAR